MYSYKKKDTAPWWVGLCLVGTLALGSCGSNVPKSYTEPYGGRVNDGPQPKDAGISGIEGRDRIQNNDVDGDNGRVVAAYQARLRNEPPPTAEDLPTEDGEEMGGTQAEEAGGPGEGSSTDTTNTGGANANENAETKAAEKASEKSNLQD